MLLENRYAYNPSTDRIGKGGFGTVYKAWDEEEEREVALKFVQKSKLPQRYSLQEELKKVKDLHHPNLVRYYDFFTKSYENVAGEMDEMQIGVMEYVNGGDLAAFMKMSKSNLTEKITLILKGILEGLNYLHERSFIHRDIKPQNILLQIDNKQIIPKIADFSISKQMSSDLTSVSAAVGTYEYMSPEQLGKADAKLGITTDIWAFGVLTYHLLTKDLPFGSRRKGDTDGQIIANIMKADLPKLTQGLETPFGEIVARCLEKNPQDRFQSAKVILEKLPYVETQTEDFQNDEATFTTQVPLVEDEVRDVKHLDMTFEDDGSEDTIFSNADNALRETQEDRNPKPLNELRDRKNEEGEPDSKKPSKLALWLVGLVLFLISALVLSQYLISDKKEAQAKKQKKQNNVESKEDDSKVSKEVQNSKLRSNTIPPEDRVPNDNTRKESSSENKHNEKRNKENTYTYEIENGENDIEITYTHKSPEEKKQRENYRDRKPKKTNPKQNKSKYDYVEEYAYGAIVARNGKYGYVDTNGKEIIPLRYEGFSNFSEGLAAVKYKGKWGFIDKYGRRVISFRYDRPGKFKGGKAHVELNGREIYINKNGYCVENCN